MHCYVLFVPLLFLSLIYERRLAHFLHITTHDIGWPICLLSYKQCLYLSGSKWQAFISSPDICLHTSDNLSKNDQVKKPNYDTLEKYLRWKMTLCSRTNVEFLGYRGQDIYWNFHISFHNGIIMTLKKERKLFQHGEPVIYIGNQTLSDRCGLLDEAS